MKIDLKILSPKQRAVWVMRYRYGWRMKHIALKMGISFQAVSAMLLRAQRRAGATEKHRIKVIRAKHRPGRRRLLSLSDVFNY